MFHVKFEAKRRFGGLFHRNLQNVSSLGIRTIWEDGTTR